MTYLWRFDESLDRLGEDEEGDEQEEEAIYKAGYHLGAHVAVGEALVGLPLGDDGRRQSSQ